MVQSLRANSGKSLIKRELNGASFLSLEHSVHMVLIVLVPGLILAALTSGFNLWFGLGTLAPVPDVAYFVGGSWLSSIMTVGTVAAVCVTVPLLVLFGRRTRLEWRKRPGFAGRLAYKLPLYVAFTAITALVIWFKIQILSVILATLAFIGVQNAPFGVMYGSVFLPALIGLLLFAAAWWYMFALIKGKDYGQLYDITCAVIGLIVASALFITITIKLHDTALAPSGVEPLPSQIYREPYPNNFYQ